jgi:hypothetical protein
MWEHGREGREGIRGNGREGREGREGIGGNRREREGKEGREGNGRERREGGNGRGRRRREHTKSRDSSALSPLKLAATIAKKGSRVFITKYHALSISLGWIWRKVRKEEGGRKREERKGEEGERNGGRRGRERKGEGRGRERWTDLHGSSKDLQQAGEALSEDVHFGATGKDFKGIRQKFQNQIPSLAFKES